jgi:methyl-accepting chemotaxis protein
MKKQYGSVNIGALLSVVIGMMFVIMTALTIVLVRNNMRQQALVEAEAKMRLMLDRIMAAHTYFSQILKPNLLVWSEPFRTADYFDPSWMSSTYAVREMEKYFETLSPVNYYYKDAATNARNPENEADAEEATFIEELKTNPSLEERSSVRTINGTPYLVVLRKGEVMGESCLLCHGNPQDAPAELVRQYGPERSFHREADLGNIISAVSVRVPLADAYAGADRVSLQLSGALVALLGLFLVVQFWLSRQLVFAPLARLRDKALQISMQDEHLGEQIPIPFGGELGALTHAFNAMSIHLRDGRDHLEARVQ